MEYKSIKFSQMAWAAFAMLICVSFNAQAQEVGNVFTDEIIVTAQKREQNLQDVGIAVTAITGEQMQALGYTNAQEITALAPGVSTIQPNGEANYAISIRGVGNSDFITNVESPIAVYVDEVYISQMSGAGFMLFDMERAEVLRGPQGTLFGRNATGGLVQYVTVKPSQEAGGYSSFTYGEYNQIKYQGAVGVPLTDRLSMRFSGALHQRDGYIENREHPDLNLNNANEFAGRVQLLWEGEDWDVLLNMRQGRQDIRTGFFQHASSVETGQLTPGRVNPYLEDTNGMLGYIDNDGDAYAGDYDFTGHNDLETKGYSATLTWQGESMKFISITDYSTTESDYIEDTDASPDDYFRFFLTTDAEQFSQEMRLEGGTDNARWVAGVYYLDIDIDDSNGAIAPGLMRDYYSAICTGFPGSRPDPATICDSGFLGGALDGATVGAFNPGGDIVNEQHGLLSPYTTTSESWSIFGQYEHELSDALTFIIGGRWISEEKEHDFRNLEVAYHPRATSGADPRTTASGDPNLPALDITAENGAGIGFLAGYNGERDDSEWAGRLQLDWRPNDNTLYYISYNRGVKSGGFNAPLLPTTDANLDGNTDDTFVTEAIMNYEPEQLDAYEIGFKTEMMDGRVTLNGAIYYYDYQDYQAFSIIGLDTFTLNAEAESQGFELELQASPTPGLDILFGVGYIEVDVDDVPGVNTTSNKPGFEAFGASEDPGVSKRPVQTPEWNLNGLIRYEMPVAQFAGNIAFQLAAEYRDEHYFNLQNSEPLTEDGYTLLNGSIAYFPASSDSWSLRAAVHNLTDEEYIVQGFDLSGTIYAGNGFFGMTEHYYGRPRTWGISLNYIF
ncbi:MAG: TonB-dependent receptor [Alphaproteobacteria bacterium]|nr:TonB-dependent receptor [Alphaproteobacteria bacterium]